MDKVKLLFPSNKIIRLGIYSYNTVTICGPALIEDRIYQNLQNHFNFIALQVNSNYVAGKIPCTKIK